jgi:sigma-B regulation protein RsbU (phosphoserine phosphatase)
VWLGALRDIGRATDDSTIKLAHGDVMVLYTDGVTEARSASGETFGLERLRAEIERHRAAPSTEICGAIMAAVTAWMESQADDVTVFVARYSGDGDRQGPDERDYEVEIGGSGPRPPRP